MFVVLAWGLNFSVIKLAYAEIAPAAVGLVRYLLMVPLLVLWCRFAGVSLRYARGTQWKVNLAGLLGSGLYMVLFLEGMKTASPAQAAIALAVAPVVTTLLSVAIGQDRFTWRLLAGSVVAFGGVGLVVLGGASEPHGSVTGALLVALSAVVWAASILVYRPLLASQPPLGVLTLSFPGALAAMVPYGIGPTLGTDWTSVGAVGWLAMAYLVVVAGTAAFAAYYKGLADVGPARTSMTQYFVPPTAALGAWAILGQRPGWSVWAGLAVVIGGVALATWRIVAPEPVS
jgi:drug/metabolite transporter (DMT)-like permease